MQSFHLIEEIGNSSPKNFKPILTTPPLQHRPEPCHVQGLQKNLLSPELNTPANRETSKHLPGRKGVHPIKTLPRSLPLSPTHSRLSFEAKIQSIPSYYRTQLKE